MAIARRFARTLAVNLLIATTLGVGGFAVHVHDMTHHTVDPSIHRHMVAPTWQDATVTH